jgi:gliding motility-associated-like protein
MKQFSYLLIALFGLAPVTFQAQCSVSAGSDLEMCLTEGNTLHLLGHPAGGLWSGTGVTSDGIFSANSPGHYTLQYTRTTPSGCVATDQLVVTVQAPPSVSAGADASVCLNDGIIELGADAEVHGTWSGPGVEPNGNFSPSAAGVGAHQVVLTAVVNACTVTSEKTIHVKALPSVMAGEDVQVCPNEQMVILQPIYPVGGTWSGEALSPAAQNGFHPSVGPGEYTFTYSFTSPVTGCTGTDQKTIVVQEAPAAAFEMAMEVSCDFPVVVPVSANQTEGATYTWKINGQPSTALYFDALGQYQIERIATKNGCSSSASAMFEVKNKPHFDIVSSASEVCPGEQVVFEAQGEEEYMYMWSFSNGTAALSTEVNTSFATPGDYGVNVTAISNNGCTESKSYQNLVHIHASPEVSVMVSVPVVEAGEPFLLEAPNVNEAMWFFTDGQLLEGTSVEAVVHQTGEQWITVEAHSNEGCVSRVEHRLEVVQQKELTMPGQFSPNQDGPNDVFRPIQIGDWSQFVLTVFDLQGRVVFQGTNAFDGWNGEGAQQGIYVYQVSIEEADSRVAHHQSGRVLLVR